MRTVIATLTKYIVTDGVSQYATYSTVHIVYKYGSKTWYTISRCVILFYVPAPVYVIVSHTGVWCYFMYWNSGVCSSERLRFLYLVRT